MPDMRQTNPFRNQELNAVSTELAGIIFEQMASFIAGEEDSSRLVNDECGLARAGRNTLQDRDGTHEPL